MDQICDWVLAAVVTRVSRKSGLEGRNNAEIVHDLETIKKAVSMKSGLEGRNN